MNKQNGIGSVMALSPSEFEAVVKVYNMQNGTNIAGGGRAGSPGAKRPAGVKPAAPKASASNGEKKKRDRGPNGLSSKVREYLRANNGVVMSDALTTLESQGLDKEKVRQAIYVLKSNHKVDFDGKGVAAKIDSSKLGE